MPRYDFKAPGTGMAAGIEAFLLERERRKQQAIEDALRQQQAERQNRLLALQEQQEVRYGQEAISAAERQKLLDKREAEKEARERSTAANTLGMRQRIAGAMPPGGAAPSPELARQIAMMGYQEGVEVPGIISEAMKPRQRYPVTTPGQGGGPLHRLASEEEMIAGVPGYVAPDKPPTPTKPNREWVKRPGVGWVNIVEGTSLPGDVPQAVAAKEGDAGPGTMDAYGTERTTRMRQTIGEILGKKDPTTGAYQGGLISPWTTGMGSLLKDLPGSEALQLKVKLKTLSAATAFNELAEMRAASKTGGALGSIAVRELELLESSLGGIEQGLAGTDLVAELEKIQASLDRWETAKAAQKAQSNILPTPGADLRPTISSQGPQETDAAAEARAIIAAQRRQRGGR